MCLIFPVSLVLVLLCTLCVLLCAFQDPTPPCDLRNLYQGPITPCGQGFGLAVCPALNVLVVTQYLTCTIAVYSM